MHIRKIMMAASVAGASFLGAPAAVATSLVKQDFDEMARNANVCVIATAVSTKSAVRDGAPVTETVFTVDDVAFGSPARTITVVSDGGRIPNAKAPMAEVVAGAPRFFSGGSSLLLLTERSDGAYGVVNFSQGVFPVVETVEGASVTLPASAGGVTAVDTALDAARNARNAADAPTMDE
ncbi:MAG: hypothetical protein ACFB00_06505 [Parvularculaceae bacterium]